MIMMEAETQLEAGEQETETKPKQEPQWLVPYNTSHPIYTKMYMKSQSQY